MRLFRIAGLIIFILSSVAFIAYRVYEYTNTDVAGPEITFPTDVIYAEVNAAEDVLLQDVRAYDEKDGDVTGTLIIESISKFVSPGKRIITYAAFDKSNNISKKERYLVYTDYTTPKFSLSRPLSFIAGEYANIIEFMTVEDCIDGDLSSNIRYMDLDSKFGIAEGEFIVNFWVTNSCGDTAYLPAKVEYHYPTYDINKIPVIILDNYIVYVEQGSTFFPNIYPIGFSLGSNKYSFLEKPSFNINGKIVTKSMIEIDSNVNTNVPGVYYVDYILTIEEGLTGKTTMIVVVE